MRSTLIVLILTAASACSSTESRREISDAGAFDARGSEAGSSEAGDAASKISIGCDTGLTCDRVCCRDTGAAPFCGTRNSDCFPAERDGRTAAGASFECDGPEDCASPGQRCCIRVSARTLEATCSAPADCDGSAFQRIACSSPADCPRAGSTCEASGDSTLPPTMKTCN